MSEDAELVARLKRRDERAFTELVNNYQRRVFGLSYRMLGNAAEAEDITQEVFVAVFKHITNFRGDSKLSTWILRITTNHCRNRLRYLKRRHYLKMQPLENTAEADFMMGGPARPPRPDKVAEGRQLSEVIKAGIASLEDDHREVLVLRDMEHLSYQEIAEVLDIAEGTVKSRLFRARVALKAYISGKYPLDGGEG